MTQIQTASPQGYVLGAREGEHLSHFGDAGNIFIKVGPGTGSENFALGTQQVRVGWGHSDPPALANGRSLLRPGGKRNLHTE